MKTTLTLTRTGTAAWEADSPTGEAFRRETYARAQRWGRTEIYSHDGIMLEYVEPDPDARAGELRSRKNASARARYDAYRSVGMVKTPYGWE